MELRPRTPSEVDGVLPNASVLVGREAERERAAAFLDALTSGAPYSLSIEGEAGIGKSALWSEAVSSAELRGYRTLVARPVENEAVLSFTGLVDLLEHVLDETLPQLPEPQRRALEVALLLRAADGPPDLRALSTGFLSVLRVLGARTPVVVAVDDAQWLDSASSGILAFAARRLSTEPVGLLLAERVDEAGSDALHAALGGRLDRLVPSPLSLGALHRLLQARFGRPFSRPVVRRFREISAGNPYFTLELAHALEGRPLDAPDAHDVPLPNTLRDVVRHRVATLPAEERRLLLAVAASSQPTFDLLGHVVGGRVDATSLREAVATQVVVLEGARVRFAHPLLGSVVYADADGSERKRLHSLLADLVTSSEDAARHLALATDAPDADVAARLDDAARSVRARGAPDRAASLFGRAIDLTPAGDPLAHRRLLAAADCWTDAGDAARATPLLERAIAEAPPGTARAEALAKLGWIRCRTAGYRAGSGLFEEAAREGATDPSVVIAIEKGLGWTDHMLGDLVEAEGHVRKAAALGEQLGDAVTAAESLADLAFVEMLRGRPHFAETMRRALALDEARTQAGRSRWLDHRARWLDALILAWTDELDAARTSLTRLQSEAADAGHEHVRAYLSNWLGRVDCFAGHWRDGLAHAIEAHEESVHARLEAERPYTLSTIALARAHLGEVAAASAAIEDGLQLARTLNLVPAELELLAVRGFLELSLDEPGNAHAVLLDLARRAAEAGFAQPAVQRFHPDLIEAAVAVGDLDTARRQVEELRVCAHLLQSPWPRSVGARCEGIVAAADGDLPGALDRFDVGLVEHQRLPSAFEQARTVLQRGIVLRRLRRKRDARASIQAARDVFLRSGAVLWIERADAELARISGAAPKARTGLTETEQRVASLVAVGRANKEIAAELHVTVRTVESNLTRIYKKLGIRSRSQLAAHMHELPSSMRVGFRDFHSS